MLWFTCPSVPWLISLLSHGSSLVLFRGSFSLFSIVRLAFFSVIRLSFFPWFASLSFPDDSYWLGLVTMHQRSDTTRPVQQLAGERAAWTMEVPQYRPSTSRASFSTIMNSILGIPRLYTGSTSPYNEWSAEMFDARYSTFTSPLPSYTPLSAYSRTF
jgi:hypothetical protein